METRLRRCLLSAAPLGGLLLQAAVLYLHRVTAAAATSGITAHNGVAMIEGTRHFLILALQVMVSTRRLKGIQILVEKLCIALVMVAVEQQVVKPGFGLPPVAPFRLL